jgi:hypothetical protein
MKSTSQGTAGAGRPSRVGRLIRTIAVGSTLVLALSGVLVAAFAVLPSAL